MKNNIKKLIKVLLIPVSYINKIIPKQKKNIVIYSNLGFRDNIKSIYDFLIENKYNEKYKIVCSLDDYKLYKSSTINNVKFVSNIRGIFYYLTSKYCFYSFGKYPIKPSNSQVVINLWHGMPLKKIGNMEDATRNEDYNYFSYIIATSEFFGKIMQKSFNCTKNQILICGQPRNDELFIKNSLKKDIQIENFDKVIIWLPTFRKSSRLNLMNTKCEIKSELNFPIIDNIEKMKEINEILKYKNSILIIKPHPMQDLNDKDLIQYSNIKILTQELLNKNNISVYNLIKESDSLITDYSSVYFDYLLLNRPIGFTINDINDYSDSRGFVIDNPFEIMPGEMITDYKSFKIFIKNTIEGFDKYSEKRKSINELCNVYKNGGFCKQILEFCDIKI